MKELNFPFNLVIPPEFGGAMDEATFYPWVKFHEIHKSENTFESYTLELGSEEIIDSKAGKADAINIFNYLVKKGVIEDKEIECPKNEAIFCLLKDYKSFFAPKSGFVEYL